MHMGDTPVTDKLNDYPPFVFMPGKAKEVRDDFLARAILEHKGIEGLTEVEPIGYDDMGLPKFDFDGAKKKAIENLKRGQHELVMTYIKTQQEYRISSGKPPLPPSPVVARIIAKNGIDLEKEGINLAGAGFKLEGQDMVKRVETLESQLEGLLEQNKLLQEQNNLLKAKKGV
jgi:hypothetical protein